MTVEITLIKLEDAEKAIGNLVGRLIDIITKLKSAVLGDPAQDDVEFYTPLLQSLQKIHALYSNLFYELQQQLPVKQYEGAWIIPNHSPASGDPLGYCSKEEVDARVKKLKDAFLQKRIDPEYHRAQFRAKAKGLLQSAKKQDSCRFLATVLMFFVEDGVPTYNVVDELDRLIERIRSGGADNFEGPDKVINSPSYRLEQKLQKATDPDELRQAAIDAWKDLATRIALVNQFYYAMHFNHISPGIVSDSK